MAVQTDADLSVWASSLNLICNAQACPRQVGLLVFVTKTGNIVQYTRCTASLIAPDKILTNGHCDHTGEGREGYFITQKINGKQKQIKIQDLSFKQYTRYQPSPGVQLTESSLDENWSSGEIDVAIFTLEQTIDAKDIPPFSLPAGNTPNFDTLYSYVINSGQDEKTFLIDEKICLPKRHEILFPFDFAENPDVFSMISCEAIPGNSGAPILSSRTSTEVAALVVGFSNIEMRHQDYLKQYGRLPPAYEDYGFMLAANLRCANLLDGHTIAENCTRASNEEKNVRYNNYYQQNFSLLVNRVLAGADTQLFKYTAYPYIITNNIQGAPQERFVIYYFPDCRKQNANPQSLPLFVEEVEFIYDAYAKIEIKSLSTQEILAEVTEIFRNDVFGLKVQWPTYTGEFSSPPASQQLGSEFNLSIPVCEPE